MLSHISLWMQNSAQEKPYILVLEDDAVANKFTEVLRQIVDQIATTDFDIVQLSGVDDATVPAEKFA